MQRISTGRPIGNQIGIMADDLDNKKFSQIPSKKITPANDRSAGVTG